jgi:hypothetical protein
MVASLIGHVGMAYVLSVVYNCQARAWGCGLLISGDYFQQKVKKRAVLHLRLRITWLVYLNNAVIVSG